MPHIDIKCFPGRTQAQKKLLAEKIAQDVAEIFGTELDSVSVAIQDIAPRDWKRQVWEKEIVPKQNLLYKRPGYDYDD